MGIQSFQMPIGNGHWESNFFNRYFSPIVVESKVLPGPRFLSRSSKTIAVEGDVKTKSLPPGESYTRFLVPKKLTFPSVLTKQCGVVPGM